MQETSFKIWRRVVYTGARGFLLIPAIHCPFLPAIAFPADQPWRMSSAGW